VGDYFQGAWVSSTSYDRVSNEDLQLIMPIWVLKVGMELTIIAA